jgi:hypothetical protein
MRPLGGPTAPIREMRTPRARKWRAPDRALTGAWCFAIAAWLAMIWVIFTPWQFETAARHLAAALGCDAARSVGLAPAKRGQPGYWTWLDRKGDGVACKS